MTGRELIVYILANHLEDTQMFSNDKIVGLMTEDETATKMSVGPATVRTWYELGYLKGIKINNKVYICDSLL